VSVPVEAQVGGFVGGHPGHHVSVGGPVRPPFENVTVPGAEGLPSPADAGNFTLRLVLTMKSAGLLKA
jgi:hypothetical protein